MKKFVALFCIFFWSVSLSYSQNNSRLVEHLRNKYSLTKETKFCECYYDGKTSPELYEDSMLSKYFEKYQLYICKFANLGCTVQPYYKCLIAFDSSRNFSYRFCTLSFRMDSELINLVSSAETSNRNEVNDFTSRFCKMLESLSDEDLNFANSKNLEFENTFSLVQNVIMNGKPTQKLYKTITFQFNRNYQIIKIKDE